MYYGELVGILCSVFLGGTKFGLYACWLVETSVCELPTCLLAKVVWFLVQEKIGCTLSYPGIRVSQEWWEWELGDRGTKQGICCL